MSEWCAGGLARSLGGYFGRLDAPWAVGCVQPAVAVFALFRMLLLATRKRRDGLSWDRRVWPAATSSQPLTLAAGVQRSGDPSSVLFSRRAAGSRAHAAWHHGAMNLAFAGRWPCIVHRRVQGLWHDSLPCAALRLWPAHRAGAEAGITNSIMSNTQCSVAASCHG
jgi:hypothetical protein